jgi:uncharacterized protein with GYD domain
MVPNTPVGSAIEGDVAMARYLWQVSYTVEGAKGLAAEGGSSRREAIQQMLDSVGGRLESFYYAFGTDDLIVIGELPDNVSAAALSLQTAASGAARSRTVVLLTPEEIDEAARRQVEYRPPGG